jgi:Ni,Fe-hydrogenase I cytochrome b subunit
MVFIFVLTNWFGQAYETTIWPLLGFIFMPFTTLAYMAAAINTNHHISGGWMVLVIVAVFFDLTATGSSAKSHTT